MNCVYFNDKQYRGLYCYVDDGFGNIWEAAGSYYFDTVNLNEDLLHPRMIRMNMWGALYHIDMANLEHVKWS